MNGRPKLGRPEEPAIVDYWVSADAKLAAAEVDQGKPFVKRVANGSFGRNPSFPW
jgi:hypothetical protein